MEYPEMLPAGTVIRLNKRGKSKYFLLEISSDAVGLVAQLTKDAKKSDEPSGCTYYTTEAQVIENPNGWPHDIVNHRIDLRYDEIVQISNKVNKFVLDNPND